MVSKTRRAMYRAKGKTSKCRGKRIRPNKCKNIKYCKVARGTQRQYCRKKKAKRYTRSSA